MDNLSRLIELLPYPVIALAVICLLTGFMLHGKDFFLHGLLGAKKNKSCDIENIAKEIRDNHLSHITKYLELLTSILHDQKIISTEQKTLLSNTLK